MGGERVLVVWCPGVLVGGERILVVWCTGILVFEATRESLQLGEVGAYGEFIGKWVP